MLKSYRMQRIKNAGSTIAESPHASVQLKGENKMAPYILQVAIGKIFNRFLFYIK